MAELVAAKKKVLDMTNVKERGPWNPTRMESGDYVAKVVAVYETTTKANNEQMWVFAFQPQDFRSAVYPYYCVLNTDNYWKIRTVCMAAGMAVPKKRVALDPNKLVGKTIGITLIDDEYDGKVKSIVDGVMSADGLVGPSKQDIEEEDIEDDELEEEEEEAPAPKRRTAAKKAPAKKAPVKRKPAPVEEDDEDEDLDEDDLDELDVDEI